MKQVRFADISIRLSVDEQIPVFALPLAVVEEEPGDHDLSVRLSIGSLKKSIPQEHVRYERGGLKAYGDSDRIVWSHNDLGVIIETHSRSGEIQISLPTWAWTKITNVFDQLILPGLLPAFDARGLRAMHASSVDIQGYGFFVAGESGIGKTTAALLLVANGKANLVADDLTFFYRNGDKRMICGLGDGVRAHEDVWGRFPHLRPPTGGSGVKRHLDANALPRTRTTEVKRGVILGTGEDRQRLTGAEAIPRLLSLVYRGSSDESALSFLNSLIQDVSVIAANSAEVAATIAMQVDV